MDNGSRPPTGQPVAVAMEFFMGRLRYGSIHAEMIKIGRIIYEGIGGMVGNVIDRTAWQRRVGQIARVAANTVNKCSWSPSGNSGLFIYRVPYAGSETGAVKGSGGIYVMSVDVSVHTAQFRAGHSGENPIVWLANFSIRLGIVPNTMVCGNVSISPYRNAFPGRNRHMPHGNLRIADVFKN